MVKKTTKNNFKNYYKMYVVQEKKVLILLKNIRKWKKEALILSKKSI